MRVLCASAEQPTTDAHARPRSGSTAILTFSPNRIAFHGGPPAKSRPRARLRSGHPSCSRWPFPPPDTAGPARWPQRPGRARGAAEARGPAARNGGEGEAPRGAVRPAKAPEGLPMPAGGEHRRRTTTSPPPVPRPGLKAGVQVVLVLAACAGLVVWAGALATGTDGGRGGRGGAAAAHLGPGSQRAEGGAEGGGAAGGEPGPREAAGPPPSDLAFPTRAGGGSAVASLMAASAGPRERRRKGRRAAGRPPPLPRLDPEEGKQRWERYMKAYDEKRRGGNPEVRRSGAASRRDGTDAPSAVWGAQREANVLGQGLAGRIEAQEVDTVAEPREQPADGRRRHDGEPPPPRAAAPGGRGPGTDRRGDPLWANASCARGSTAPRARRASGSSSPAWRPAARSGRRRLR